MPIKGEPNLFHKEYFYQEPDNPILPIGSQDLPPFGPPYEDSEKVFESIKNSEHKNYVDKPENSHTYENNFIESYQSTLFRKTPRQKLKFQREAPTFETNVNEFNQYKPDYEPAIDDIAAPSPLYESDNGQYGGYEFPKFESKHEEINFGNSVKSKINGKLVLGIVAERGPENYPSLRRAWGWERLFCTYVRKRNLCLCPPTFFERNKTIKDGGVASQQS